MKEQGEWETQSSLGMHYTVRSVTVYLHLGLGNIRDMLMQKRFLFLHYILNQDNISFIHQTPNTIFDNPRKNDATQTKRFEGSKFVNKF